MSRFIFESGTHASCGTGAETVRERSHPAGRNLVKRFRCSHLFSPNMSCSQGRLWNADLPKCLYAHGENVSDSDLNLKLLSVVFLTVMVARYSLFPSYLRVPNICAVREQSCCWYHRRTGIFLPEGAVNHLPKKFLQVAQILWNSRKETRVIRCTNNGLDMKWNFFLIYESTYEFKNKTL